MRAAYSVPSLTTIAPGKETVAQGAIATLLELMSDKTAEQHDVEVGYQLIVRESSQPAS